MPIGYVTIGALDTAAAGKFYDALFTPLGSERKLSDGGWLGYGELGAPGEGFMACHSAICCPPHDGKPARAGNGIMVSYVAKSPDAVKAAHAAGLANGGTDEGAPGFRPPEAKSGFYGAYLRDPTGNKLCIFCTA
ncbi:MAG: VOC family protein [Pseudomonadota bacterium]|nr:VOC family protein [Pseudomonadota bacterium]